MNLKINTALNLGIIPLEILLKTLELGVQIMKHFPLYLDTQYFKKESELEITPMLYNIGKVLSS